MSKKSELFGKVRSFLTKQIIYTAKTFERNEKAFLVREVRYTDIRHLIAIEKDAYEGAVPWGKTAFLSELNGTNPVLYLLVEYDEKVVGFIGTRFVGNNGHITNIAVKKDYQGNGLGTFLMQEVKAIANHHEIKSLSLEVRISNMDAQRLYRKFGFVSRSVKKKYYHSNGEDALDMIYRIED